MTFWRDALDFVLYEKVNAFLEVTFLLLRFHVWRYPGELVFQFPLLFLRLFPGACPRHAAVLHAILSPTQMLTAFAPPAKLIPKYLQSSECRTKIVITGEVLIPRV